MGPHERHKPRHAKVAMQKATMTPERILGRFLLKGGPLEEKYMKRAIELAQKGVGWVSPNPLVGAVLVKEGRVIGEGYHHRHGDLHAEREALKDCRERGEDPRGATIYVTLEPCCHTGSQPPCTEALMEAGIARLVCGSDDPNPKVAGKGFRILEEAGVEVHRGFLKEDCDGLNEIFFHYIQSGRPYVALKYAMTLDGKIASRTGDSRGISSMEANRWVHGLRHRYRGILVGMGTVMVDDPLLTCRLEGGRNPVRVILDSDLRIPMESRLVKTAQEVPTILACLERAPSDKKEALVKAGARVLTFPDEEGRIPLADLLDRLGKEGIDSLLVEGGSEVHASFLDKPALVQKVYTIVTPKLLGGREAKTPVGGLGLEKIAQALPLEFHELQRMGPDLVIESRLSCSPE